MLKQTMSVAAFADVTHRARGPRAPSSRKAAAIGAWFLVRWAVPLLAAVCGLLVAAGSSRAEFLYVSEGSTTISILDPGGTRTTFVSSGLSTPEGLAFDTAGNLFVANFNGGTITRITPAGAQSTFFSGLLSPTGLAFDTAGNLYVATQGDNSIRSITPGGSGTVFANTGLSVPFGLAFDTAGNLYAANLGNNTIEKFGPTGTDLGVFASAGLNGPEGLAFDAAGNLYASNFISSTITRITPGGTSSLFASTGLSNPVGLAFDTAGNLYAANYGDDTIERFTPGGTPSLFASGFDNPTFMAFTAVPEPATWTLATLGAFGLTVLHRRRRRQS